MDVGTLLSTLAAALLGMAAVLVAYRLEKVHRHPFLADYVMFLVLAATWGFALWTVPALLSVVSPTAGQPTGMVRLPLVSKWFGFPFHLLQLYFQVLMLSGLLERPITPSFRRLYLWGSVVVLTVLFAALVNMLWGGSKDVFAKLHSSVTTGYLLLEALAFAWGVARAREVADPGRRWIVGWFSWLYLGGFVAYWALTSLATASVPASAWLFAAYHWPPLIVVEWGLQRHGLAIRPATSPGTVTWWLDRFDLTERERDVVGRLLDGQSNRRIADELFLSHQTVKNYVSRVYRKINVSSRVELVVAVRNAEEERRSRP